MNKIDSVVCLLGNEVVNVLVSLQFLFHVDEQTDTVDHFLDQLDLKKTDENRLELVIRGTDNTVQSTNLRLAKSVQVGYVKSTTYSSSVHTAGPSLLKAKFSEDFREALVLEKAMTVSCITRNYYVINQQSGKFSLRKYNTCEVHLPSVPF